jgi:nucleotide-binding universal stress UspA family protein
VANIRAFSRVVVALDFSPHSTAVLARLALLPLMRRTRVTLVHVRPPAPVDLGGQDLHQAARILADTAAEQLRRQFGSGGPTVEPVVARGLPVRVIAARARAAGAELVVLGRRGSGVFRRLALGSTAEGVLHTGVAPVLVVGGTPAGVYQTPLVATDLSTVATTVLREVRRLLPATIRAVELLHVFQPSWADALPILGGLTPAIEAERLRLREQIQRQFDRLAPQAADLGLPVQLQLRDGDPREVVVETARELNSDLIAMGTRGPGRAARSLIGSVASSVLREATCDVFVVPPRK